MSRPTLQTRFLDLTQVLLPSRGRTHNWPIRDEHSFTRIVLDHLFHDAWYNHLDRGLRVHRQLSDTQLAQAVAIAERMYQADDATIRAMEQQSQAWREQPVPLSVKHHPPQLTPG